MDWNDAGPLGSVRRAIRKTVSAHIRENEAISNLKRSSSSRVIDFVVASATLPRLAIGYLFIFVTPLAFQFVALSSLSVSAKPWMPRGVLATIIENVTQYLLVGQITILGLLVPVAVALVTLVINRETSSNSVADLHVYYAESYANRIATSGIALAIVLTITLFIPSYSFLLPLSLVNSAWFLFNLVATHHFVLISLAFPSPSARASMRRSYAARIAIPQLIYMNAARHLYLQAVSQIDPRLGQTGKRDELPHAVFGSAYGATNVEVEIVTAKAVTLADVWFAPLIWVIRRWRQRCENAKSDAVQDVRPTLWFPQMFGSKTGSRIILCQRSSGVPLTRLEKLVIRISFRFEQADR